MNLAAAVSEALGAIRAHPLRSLLTTLGIIIGVAAVIAMVAVGSGARDQVRAQIAALGSDAVDVQPGVRSNSGARLSVGTTTSLTEGDALAIRAAVPEAAQVSASMTSRAQFVAGNLNWSASLHGTWPEYFDIRNWPAEVGRTFDAADLAGQAKVVVLGRTVADALFGVDDPTGREVRINNVPFLVIGVLERKGLNATGDDRDDAAFAPLATVRGRVLPPLPGPPDGVRWISLKMAPGVERDELTDAVTALLRQRHRLGPGQADDFTIRAFAEAAELREQSSDVLATLLFAVAGVSLAVGGIGIMNIMLVSVTERTREIGLRLALGARQRDILAQFLVESAVLAAIGGLVGALFGVGVASLLAWLAGWPTVIDPLTLVLAVGGSAVVGIVFGLYPAGRAARLDPIEALRRE
jgi:putative ABC transport system permease protein